MIKTKEQAEFHYHQELGGLEMVDAHYHQRNFSKHCHETYTISVIETGVQRFYRSGGEHFAPQHAIILVNADDVHTGQAATEQGWSYRALYPLESHFQQIAQAIGMNENFAPYFKQAVIFDEEISLQLRAVFDCLTTQDNLLQRETAVISVLQQLMMKHGSAKAIAIDERNYHSGIEQVRDYLQDNLLNDVRLSDLTSICGLSPSHLVRSFKKQFGLAPHAYQIQHRLIKGKSLLKQGMSVAQSSIELGFHDQSHFHRHFKKTIGVTPGCYAKAIR